MYSPKFAVETNKETINQVILENPFATIVYQNEAGPQSFPLPLFLENDKLIGHMARANFAWKELNNTSILIIFHGPHCYISADWYGSPGNVPTWNYISVQVRGNVKITHEESFLRKAIIDLGKILDPTFDIEKNVNDHQNLLGGVVGIEIAITDIFAKFKLAQNKHKDERTNVIRHLEKSSRTAEQLVAKAMQKTLS